MVLELGLTVAYECSFYIEGRARNGHGFLKRQENRLRDVFDSLSFSFQKFSLHFDKNIFSYVFHVPIGSPPATMVAAPIFHHISHPLPIPISLSLPLFFLSLSHFPCLGKVQGVCWLWRESGLVPKGDEVNKK